MAFSLRLPETLEADARAKAAQLGIPINALVCVAVDAYLRGSVLQAISAIPEPTPVGYPDLPIKARPEALKPISEPLAPSPTIPPASTPITTPEPVKAPPVRQPSRQERRKLERLRAKAASNAS